MMPDDLRRENAEEAAVDSVTHDSFTTNSIIEIVPIDSADGDSHMLEFLHPVPEVKPEISNHTNQESSDEYSVSISP